MPTYRDVDVGGEVNDAAVGFNVVAGVEEFCTGGGRLHWTAVGCELVLEGWLEETHRLELFC